MKRERDKHQDKKNAIAARYRKKYKNLESCWYVQEFCIITETELCIDRNVKSNMLFNQIHHVGRI